MNAMKEVKIIQSKTEPNKNHLWLSDEGLRQFKGTGWEQVLSNDNECSGDSDNEILYYDIKGTELANELSFYAYASLCKLYSGDESASPFYFITTMGAYLGAYKNNFELVAIGYDFNLLVSNSRNGYKETPIKELLGGEVLVEYLKTFQITKEQFYNLN